MKNLKYFIELLKGSETTASGGKIARNAFLGVINNFTRCNTFDRVRLNYLHFQALH